MDSEEFRNIAHDDVIAAVAAAALAGSSSSSEQVPANSNLLDPPDQILSMINSQAAIPLPNDPLDPSFNPRCVEEDYCIILERNQSTSAKSSNTRYKCRFCDFEFVGGPQKIRVHLTGRRENGTRLSRCEKVPDTVKTFMESRMKPVCDPRNNGGVYPDQDTSATGLQPRNEEERHVIVLSRSGTSKSKGSNSLYKCKYCRFKFVGGPQKIRVHLTGQPEGGTRIAKCHLVPTDIAMLMDGRKRKNSIQQEMPTLVPHLSQHPLYPMIASTYVPLFPFVHHAQYPMIPMEWNTYHNPNNQN